MKSKVNKLDVDNLKPFPTVLSRVSDVGKNKFYKKDELVKKVNAISVIEYKILSITGLATTAALNAVKNEKELEMIKLTIR